MMRKWFAVGCLAVVDISCISAIATTIATDIMCPEYADPVADAIICMVFAIFAVGITIGIWNMVRIENTLKRNKIGLKLIKCKLKGKVIYIPEGDVIKALECCSSGETSEVCIGCPLSKDDMCWEGDTSLHKVALDLIMQYKKENERLIHGGKN